MGFLIGLHLLLHLKLGFLGGGLLLLLLLLERLLLL